MKPDAVTEWARRVSILFNPLVIGTPVVILIGIKDQGGIRLDQIPMVLLCIFILCVFPLVYTLMLLRMGLIKNFHISDRRDRIYLFPVLLVCFVLVLLILNRNLGVSPLVKVLIGFGLVNCLLCALISVRFKISLHCAGLGSLAIGVFYAFGPVGLGLALAGTAATAWSRLVLKEHTAAEVASGTLFGLLATAAEFHFFY